MPDSAWNPYQVTQWERKEAPAESQSVRCLFSRGISSLCFLCSSSSLGSNFGEKNLSGSLGNANCCPVVDNQGPCPMSSHEWELITPFCECHTSKLKVLPAWSMIFRRKRQPLSCQTSLATLQDSMVGRNFVWDSTEQALLVMTWGERSRQILDLLSYIASGQGFSKLGGGGLGTQLPHPPMMLTVR